ncbi:3419_t:CDS:1, partial [Funneliformis geosporum]
MSFDFEDALPATIIEFDVIKGFRIIYVSIWWVMTKSKINEKRIPSESFFDTFHFRGDGL